MKNKLAVILLIFLLTPISGCILDGGSEGVKIRVIDIGNAQDKKNEVEVMVTRDGGIIYWESHQLEASEGNVAGDVRIFKEWMREPNDYDIYLKLENSDERRHIDITEIARDMKSEVGCVDVIVKISEVGNLLAFTSTSKDKCEELSS